MAFFKEIGKALSGAVSFVGEKNRRTAYVNRIRTVIRCEEKAAEKEYATLGRYYYNNLRDKSNPVTEAHCVELEAIEARLEKALDQLEQFYQLEQQEASKTIMLGSEGGPVAVYITRDCAEEVTLDDVESFDHDPMAEPAEKAPETPAPAPARTVEPEDNSDLPFEG